MPASAFPQNSSDIRPLVLPNRRARAPLRCPKHVSGARRPVFSKGVVSCGPSADRFFIGNLRVVREGREGGLSLRAASSCPVCGGRGAHLCGATGGEMPAAGKPWPAQCEQPVPELRRHGLDARLQSRLRRTMLLEFGGTGSGLILEDRDEETLPPLPHEAAAEEYEMPLLS